MFIPWGYNGKDPKFVRREFFTPLAISRPNEVKEAYKYHEQLKAEKLASNFDYGKSFWCVRVFLHGGTRLSAICTNTIQLATKISEKRRIVLGRNNT